MIGIKNGKSLVASALACSCFFSAFDAQAIEAPDIKQKIEHIIEWKKADSKQLN